MWYTYPGIWSKRPLGLDDMLDNQLGPGVALSFYPTESKLSLFLSYGQLFLRYWTFFKIAILGHECWPLTKVPEVAHILLSTPYGSKLSSLSLYSQWFTRYGPIFKLATFENETWPLTKVPEVAYILSTPGCRNGAYFCSMGSGFWDMGWFSKLPYMGMKLSRWAKLQKLHIYMYR